MAETKPAPKWDDVHGLVGTTFAEKAELARSLMQTIRELQTDLDATKAELLAELERVKADSVLVGEARVSRAKGRETRKLDVDKLKKLGCKVSWIDASWEVTTGKPSLRITVREDASEEVPGA